MSRTPEEWGRIAVSLPGWEWMTGMQTLPLPNPELPDPDHPATAGCMLELLGEQWGAYHYRPTDHPAHTPYEIVIDGVGEFVTDASTLGRSCIIAAAALGRWPGGDK